MCTVVSGVVYLTWRWTDSLNWDAWWIAVPLVLAETYTFIDVVLFGLTMSQSAPRPEPPALVTRPTVDAFITTYDEPVELVRTTAIATRDLAYPHSTWILDDGDRPAMRHLAAELGVDYVTRGQEWRGRPRHAKAGNVNNALAATAGEFVLILDADQVPQPHLLDRTLGWFNDPLVALVQTPQYFVNVPKSDPLGSQAPLFYGPIQQGKDGWNAAFFCGSNAVLRREALMEAGLIGYVRDTEYAMRRALRTSHLVLSRARRAPGAEHPVVAHVIGEVDLAVREVSRRFDAGLPLAEVSLILREHVDSLIDDGDGGHLPLTRADADLVRALHDELVLGFDSDDVDDVMDRAVHHVWTPEGALELVQSLVTTISVERADEAHAVMPLATDSVTEDMATSMRLHALGWSSVYHHEVLVHGLAPTDLGSMLKQRLRWAQGTMQVALRTNPLGQQGLSLGQRLMYFATTWSYLSGYATVIFLASPIIYLLLGILPVDGLSTAFFSRFVPFMVFSQLMFLVAGWGIRTLRGQQYSMALFPIWIEACSTAAKNVWFGRPLSFTVTPKTAGRDTALDRRLIRPQIICGALLVASCVVGIVRLRSGMADPLGIWLNVGWATYDVAMIGVLVSALRYRGSVRPHAASEQPAIERVGAA
ncbi:glycosyltransferase family 2 protein [Janibacter sp. G1551]|uniref:glycosyltransferase family 2 protein n=1 Tax=Janibacter sp. G1551 TaxID=3420440 RepID=UPI003D036D50